MPLHFQRADKRLRPVAFDLDKDIDRGLFVNEYGDRLTPDMVRDAMKEGGKKIVAVTFRVRYRKDRPDVPTKKKMALAIVDSAITKEQLERIVYKLTRDQYDKGGKPNG